MINNVQSLKDKIRNVSKSTSLSHNQIIQNFMFEKFLDRLSVSPYKQNFIIKGGCLLSSIMGIEMRTTMDIDANITGITFTLDKIKDIISEIIIIDVEDNVIFEIRNIEDIKEEQEYDGFRFTLLGIFGNMKVNFHLDISTGDIITPRSIQYSYKKILEDEYISLMAYNYETIIAEKLQSILNKKISNSRMKDYYDIYYFVNYRWDDLNQNHLKQAINTTFNHRNTLDDINRKDEIINILKDDISLNKLWNNYKSKFNYASNIEFIDCINAINILLDTITSPCQR